MDEAHLGLRTGSLATASTGLFAFLAAAVLIILTAVSFAAPGFT